jgi:hypothetical protein
LDGIAGVFISGVGMSSDLVSSIAAVDHLLGLADKEVLQETAQLLALMLAHHERLHGELDMSVLSEPTDEGLDEDTEDLVVRSMEILAGMLSNAISLTKAQH